MLLLDHRPQRFFLRGRFVFDGPFFAWVCTASAQARRALFYRANVGLKGPIASVTAPAIAGVAGGGDFY